VKGTDSLQISYTYSKSTLDGVTFYSTYSGTIERRTTTVSRDRYAAQSEYRGVHVAAVQVPAERRLPRHQRRAAARIGRRRSGRRPEHVGDRPAGLPQFIGRGNVESQVAIINAFRTARGLSAIDAGLLTIDPVIDLDLRLTKVIQLADRRRFEIFLEVYNLTNHTTLYAGNSTLVSSSFGIRTSALDARQTQWGARFVF